MIQKKNNIIKKIKKIKDIVTICVLSTFNNTIISALDASGNVLTWASGGSCGFKGSKKSTPFAAQNAIDNVSKKLKLMSVTGVKINFKGFGPGRESIIKGLHDFNILELKECTSIRHNGTRLPKKRRV